jgi:hypothetical protein
MSWKGNGAFVWQVKMSTGGYAANTQAGWDHLADVVLDAGMNLAPVKVADAGQVFNQTEKPLKLGWTDDILDGLFKTFERKGIQPMGWQYVYGNAPQAEAQRAITMIRRLGLEYWIIDAESEYKFKAAAAEVYMSTLMKACPDIAFALCSFRFPSLHPEFPWSTFLKYLRPGVDVHMPQVYWEQVYDPPYPQNSAEQMERSFKELKKLKDLEVVPVGPAYGAAGKNGTYWTPSLAQQDNFVRKAIELGCPGALWWELGTMLRPDFLARGYYGNMAKYSRMFDPSPQPSPDGEGELSDAEKLARLWEAHPELHPG